MVVSGGDKQNGLLCLHVFWPGAGGIELFMLSGASYCQKDFLSADSVLALFWVQAVCYEHVTNFIDSWKEARLVGSGFV